MLSRDLSLGFFVGGGAPRDVDLEILLAEDFAGDDEAALELLTSADSAHLDICADSSLLVLFMATDVNEAETPEPVVVSSKSEDREGRSGECFGAFSSGERVMGAVSYTHLTLPTIYSV